MPIPVQTDFSNGTNSSEIDDIVYRISHDLRASVRALRELPAWLDEDLATAGITLEGETAGTLDLIQSHARRLDEMLNGLLAYSRVGRLQERLVLHPQDAFNAVVAEFDLRDRVLFYTQFNPVRVAIGQSDIARIFQVLISNVVKHAGPKPRVEVVSCRSGDLWELLVSDNGPGIPDSEKDLIFKPMAKLKSRDEDEGGGMGLAILKKIVEHYDGTVHIEDRLRRGGTTFRIRIPVVAD